MRQVADRCQPDLHTRTGGGGVCLTPPPDLPRRSGKILDLSKVFPFPDRDFSDFTRRVVKISLSGKEPSILAESTSNENDPQCINYYYTRPHYIDG